MTMMVTMMTTTDGNNCNIDCACGDDDGSDCDADDVLVLTCTNWY